SGFVTFGFAFFAGFRAVDFFFARRSAALLLRGVSFTSGAVARASGTSGCAMFDRTAVGFARLEVGGLSAAGACTWGSEGAGLNEPQKPLLESLYFGTGSLFRRWTSPAETSVAARNPSASNRAARFNSSLSIPK